MSYLCEFVLGERDLKLLKWSNTNVLIQILC